jgi:hypothetical protein
MTTAVELEARWFARDNLYAQRKTYGEMALTLEEVEGIRAWRRTEANTLPGLERPKALTTLSQWMPPRGRR